MPVTHTPHPSNSDAYFGEHIAEPGHGQRSLRSGVVSIVARATNAVVQVGSVLFLARLLSPEDYGLVSMVTAITGFAPVLVDLGTRDAVAQRSRLADAEAATLFWITMAVGSASAVLVAASGPMIARFYGETRVTAIAAVSALTFVTAALTCQHYALLRRAMRFADLAVIDVTANLLSAGIAIAMAFAGFQYWALVVRPVTLNAFVAAGVWFRCRWMPGGPTMTPGVSEMLKLGLNSTGFTMTDFVGRSVDRVAIGYRVGAASLGLYHNAMFVYENVLDVLVGPLHGVAVTSLSKVRSDPPELKRLWRKALSTLAFFSMPVFGILAVTSQDLIPLVLGAKWSFAGALLSILALRGIPHTVERTLGWLHVTAGRTDRWMRWGILSTFAHLLAVFSGLPLGPVGVVTAYTLCSFILFIPALAYAGRPLAIGAADVTAAVWRPLVSALAAAAVGFSIRFSLLIETAPLIRSLCLASAYGLAYLATAVGLLGVRAPITVALQFVLDALPARFARFAKMPRFLDERRYKHT